VIPKPHSSKNLL